MTRHKAQRHTTLVLAVLFTGAFTMGCAEMLAVGMLDLISTALFADYQLFLVARVVIGAVQGLFIAAAMVTATSIVPPERSGRAMALVISGFAMASAVGLPLGTLLGQAVGWRGSFAAVVVVAAGVLVTAMVVLPSVPTAHGSGAAGQARHAFAPRVLAVLGLCTLVFMAIQSALTYLVPFPLASSLPASAVNVGIALGSFAGGVAIDVRGLHAAVLTGAVIAAIAVGAAHLTSTLRPAAAASAAPATSHLAGHT